MQRRTFLLPGGIFKIEELDGDRHDKYFIKKTEDKFNVIEKPTDKILATYNSKKEADNYFWNEIECDSILRYLNHQIEIPQQLQIKDIFALIDSHPELKILLSHIFPSFEDLGYKKAGHIIISGYANIKEDNVIESLYISNTPPTREHDSAPLMLSNKYFIRKDGKTIYEVDKKYTLLELFYYLFGQFHADPHVVLTKEGLFEGGIKCEGDESLQYLFSECTLEDNYSILDLFEFVNSIELLKIFIQMYSSCFNFDEFYIESKKSTPDQEDEDPLTATEIYLHSSFCSKKKVSWFQLDFDLHGRSKSKKTYAIEYSPVNQYSRLPLKIKNQRFVFDSSSGMPKKPAFMVIKHPTLLDILDAVFDEISYHGDIETRDAFIGKLRDISNSIKGEFGEFGEPS